MNEKIGFGLYVKTNGKEYNLTFHINYSNNVAELTAIVTAVKYLPEKSKATIFTDSQVSLQILKNKKYSGMFECLWKEYKRTVRDKNLNVKLEKVKGHIDKGNIKADNLAKQGALNGQHIDIQDLLQHKQRYLKNDEIIIFDFKKYLSSKSKEILDKNNRGKSSLHVSKDWSSINLKYIQKKMDPDTKLSVWRNLTNSHIRQFKKKNCSCCDMIVDLEHYIYYCPNTQVYRDFFKDNVYEITKTR